MYSECKLNKQGDNIQPWNTPFPILNQSLVPCPVLTVASWPALRFLQRQVTWSGIVHSLLRHTAKGFSVISEAEINVFLEFFCFFYDPTGVGNLISGFSAFSKSSLNIWEFSIHILLKPSLEDFEDYFASIWGFPDGSAGKESTCNAQDLGSIPVGKIPWRREATTPAFWPRESYGLYSPGGCKELYINERLSLASMWNECNCMVVWRFFGIAFLWDWNENWPFPVLWPLLIFPDLLAYWVQKYSCSLMYLFNTNKS